MAEAGRQPWIVFGLQRVDQGVSTVVSATSIWISLAGFTLIYGVLAAVAGTLMWKTAVQGPAGIELKTQIRSKGATLWN